MLFYQGNFKCPMLRLYIPIGGGAEPLATSVRFLTSIHPQQSRGNAEEEEVVMVEVDTSGEVPTPSFPPPAVCAPGMCGGWEGVRGDHSGLSVPWSSRQA